MRDLDDVLADLAEVRDAIDRLADDDTAGRIALRGRRDRLRAEARMIDAAADPAAATRSLRSELVALEAAWDRLAGQRIDVVKQAGGGSMGGDFGFAADAQRLNRRIDEAGGRDGIEARIRVLRSLLSDLERGEAADPDRRR